MRYAIVIENAGPNYSAYVPDLPGCVATGATLEAVERRLIETTLAQYDGHRAKTAEALGIGLRTLSGKLRQYGYAPREKNFARAS